jgi:hypothetical protein
LSSNFGEYLDDRCATRGDSDTRKGTWNKIKEEGLIKKKEKKGKEGDMQMN